MNEWSHNGALDNVAPMKSCTITMIFCYGMSRTPGAAERCDERLALKDDLHHKG